MARRPVLTYRDALRLLGAEDSRILDVVDRLGGFGATVVTGATGGALDLFGVRDELVAWGRGVLDRVADRLAGLDRFDRTERIVAAHHVLVITSFFEAVDDAMRDAGLDPAVLELTGSEQAGLAAGEPIGEDHHELVTPFLIRPLPVPDAHRPPEAVRTELRDRYRELGERLGRFVGGLAVHDRVRRRLDLADPRVVAGIAAAAVQRYRIAFRSLTAEVPEFAAWSDAIEHEATRALIRDRDETLRRLEEATAPLRSRPSACRDELVQRYRANWQRPILDGEPPEGVVLPTFAQACVVPALDVGTNVGTDVGTDAGTLSAPADDAYAWTVAHLTTPGAAQAPLLVLGQPGSGKSTFSRLLAARLPEAGFLPIRVELRSSAPGASIQDLAEAAVHAETGRRVGWPDLVEHTAGLQPVLVLDGYDELLQAGGDEHADLLERVAAFQRREFDLGRPPVAVVVTSRSAVATQSRRPEGTSVVRLRDFDRDRIGRWLDAWNAVNTAVLRERGLRPLPLDTVLAQGDLSDQPLLLLLLAVYDSGANALQAADGPIGRTELYGRVLRDFARREVRKRGEAPDPATEPDAIEAELRRLAAAAVASFARGGRAVTEAELDSDLPVLLGDEAIPGRELAARFFFVCESRAETATGRPRRVYEFVHRTFAEYLWAWWIVAALDHVDEGAGRRLRAAVSYAALSDSQVAVDFAAALLRAGGPEPRATRRTRLRAALAAAYEPVADAYVPDERTIVSRIAHRTVSLVILLVVAADDPIRTDDVVADLPGGTMWRSMASLWHSQLSLESRDGLLGILRVGGRPDRTPGGREDYPAWVGREDGSPVSIFDALPIGSKVLAVGDSWTDFTVESRSTVGRALRSAALRWDSLDWESWLLVTLIPFWRAGGDFSGSSVRSLFEILLVPAEEMSVSHRLHHYRLVFGDVADLTQGPVTDGPPAWTAPLWHRLRAEIPRLGAARVSELLDLLPPERTDPETQGAVTEALDARPGSSVDLPVDGDQERSEA